MFFEELNDDEWARIAALAADEPVHPHRRGRPRAETRVVANAVVWILTTGERWSKLPARYPSGPTCRRRFDEWLADGTLFEIVTILSECGRAFAYVPQPQLVTPPAPKPTPASESPRLRGVFWTNPESWESAGGCTQRAGDLPVAASRSLHPPADDGRGAMHERGDGMPSFNTAQAHKRTDDYCGYTIHATAQPVTRHTALAYRASAEIVEEGTRIERSGLIGPRFGDHESAERHALEWARDWIDRHTAAAAAAARESQDPTVVQPEQDKKEVARVLPAPLAAIAPSAARKLGSSTGRHAREWLMVADGRGDALPPELVHHA